jgi:hypothetical protein
LKTPLVIDCGEEIETNLETFFAANNAMEENERETIMTALESNGEYSDGGGAAAEWTLRIKPCPEDVPDERLLSQCDACGEYKPDCADVSYMGMDAHACAKCRHQDDDE